MSISPKHALTIDVEEWFHVCSADTGGPREWGALESRVEAQTDLILALLDETETRATFFVLGWVAENLPELVRRISKQGHEIGCHSHRHELVFEMSQDQFEADLERSLGALASATGQPVRSYRAPSFSVTSETPWFFESLAKHGIVLDSSICPGFRHDGGHREFSSEPARIDTPKGPVWEVPVSTFGAGPVRFGSFGGGYFRLLPKTIIERKFTRLERRGHSAVFYLHPHDLDPEQPRLQLGPVGSFRKYVGLTGAREKLRSLLSSVAFQPLSELVPNTIAHASSA